MRASDGQTGIEKWFAQADADHDGKISLAEFLADADAVFSHVDRNGDGSVVSTEVTILWEREAPEVIDNAASYEPPLDAHVPTQPGNHSDHDSNHDTTGSHIGDSRGSHHGPPPVGAQAYGLLSDPEPIMSCDSNFDRRVVKTEFEQCAAPFRAA